MFHFCKKYVYTAKNCCFRKVTNITLLDIDDWSCVRLKVAAPTGEEIGYPVLPHFSLYIYLPLYILHIFHSSMGVLRISMFRVDEFFIYSLCAENAFTASIRNKIRNWIFFSVLFLPSFLFHVCMIQLYFYVLLYVFLYHL